MPRSHRLIVCILISLMIILPQPIRAQTVLSIQIATPTEGELIRAPFLLQGTATVPQDRQIRLRVSETSTLSILIDQGVAVAGEVGQQGTFNLTVNYQVTAATPALVQVFYAGTDGSILTKSEVRVVLWPYESGAAPVTSGDPVGLAAIQLALSEYQARLQLLTPIPVSVEPTIFHDGCLGLTRSGESCIASEFNGQIVRLDFGGVQFTYHVGNDQARLNEANSAPINQRGTPVKAPKLLVEASESTGLKLYVPVGLSGPFSGLFFSRVDWGNGIVNIIYAAKDNPIDIQIVESFGNAQPVASAPNGETIQIGSVVRPVEISGGRRSVSWLIENTVVKVSVPESIGSGDLQALVTSFSLLGSNQPGQLSPFDRKQFSRLTLNLPEPTRSIEMARQAFMDLVKLPRQGELISIQKRNFNDSCLELPRQGESCAGGATPGYVIGIADTELYRYHVTGSLVRLNRENSELVNKTGTDYGTVDALRGVVQYPVAAPADATLLGAQVSQVNNVPTVLLIYRDNPTNTVFSLTESDQGVLPNASDQDQQITVNGAQVPVKNEGNGLKVTFVFSQEGKKPVLVFLWAVPTPGADNIARIANSLSAP